VLAVLLAPALLAVFLDRDPGRPTARCVVLCALAACIAPLRTFWAEGHGMEAATALVSDPATLGTAWSAAAGGWLLAELTPLAVRLALEASGRLQSARLRAERARLAEEWSPEPPVRETPSG